MWTTHRSSVLGSLDQDDSNGPGACHFQHMTSDLWADFAIFKISLFAKNQDSGERRKFVKDVGAIAKELGRFAEDYLPPLLLSLVRGLSTALLEIYGPLLNSDDVDVSESACQSLLRAGPYLCLRSSSSVLVTLLQVLHSGETLQGKLLGIRLLLSLAHCLGENLTCRFIITELMSIVDDIGTACKKEVAEHFQHLWGNVDIGTLRMKVIPMFGRLASHSEGLVRRATIPSFPIALERVKTLGKEAETVLTRLYYDLLHDKVKGVSEFAHIHLPSVLSKLSNPCPSLFSVFLETYEKYTTQDYFLACALGLPSILLTFGTGSWASLKSVYFHMIAKSGPEALYHFSKNLGLIAQCIGPQATDQDLIPVFNSFHKNKSTRIALLSSLSLWIAGLPTEDRNNMLSFLRVQGVAKDWRERAILAKELPRILPILYESAAEPIFRTALSLSIDKCDRVSVMGCIGLASILSYLYDHNLELAKFCIEVVKTWSQSPVTSSRKRFLRISSELDQKKPIFSTEFKERVLELAEDRVPNIRLLVAEIASKTGVAFDPEFARIRGCFRCENDPEISGTVTRSFDNQINPDDVLVPPLLKKDGIRLGEDCRIELNGQELAWIATIRKEVWLDEFGFPDIDKDM